MKRFALLASILLTGFFAACGSSTNPVPKANLRILHASPDAAAIDVLIDDKKILSGFFFKDAIGYNQVEAGSRNIKINTTATTNGATTTASVPLLNFSKELAEGRYYTVIAANTASAIEPLVIDEDSAEPPTGKLRLRVVHAAPAAPAVDIYVSAQADVNAPLEDINTATPAISGAAFKSISSLLDLAPSTYVVRVTGANSKTVLFQTPTISLLAGANLTLVAVEQNNLTKSPISLISLGRTYLASRSEYFDINAQVRVVHASPDVGAVDFLVDSVLAQSAVSYGLNSAYTPIVSGTRNFKINNTGITATSLVTTDTSIVASNSYSVYLMGFAATPPSAVIVADVLTPPTTGNAKLRVVHASPDTTGLDIFQGDNTIASIAGLPYKVGSIYLAVSAGAHTYKFNLTGTTNAALPAQTLTLEAGKVYTAVILGSSAVGAVNPLTLKLITDRFVSSSSPRQVIEEFPANGTSGPFTINSGALVNSEKIEVIARDRNQASLIINSQLMQRNADYVVDPLSGRILFSRPIASFDANLNPVFVHITYNL
jgi:hypothetical protein